MELSYYWPIVIVVVSNVAYHIVAKSTPVSINPLASLGITYLVGMIAVFLLYFLTSPVKSLATEYGSLNWTSFALGAAIVGLEYGFLNMYKVGWNISIGSLVASISVALILILVGILYYKETLTVPNLAGVLLCLAGLVLINR